MNGIELKSKRELKSQATTENIIRTTKMLLKEYGYDYMTIQNICTIAKVSKGTFYHYFDSKDGLLNSMTMDDYNKYKKKNATRLQKMNSLEKLFDIYKWYVGSFAENGVEFMIGYFSMKNAALKNRRTAPVFETQGIMESEADSVAAISVSTYLFVKGAQKEKLLSDKIDALELYYELEVIMFGVVFEWCQSNGSFDIQTRIEELIKKHLNMYLV